MPELLRDDSLTLVALGILAHIVADVSHEALGHGLVTLAVGAKPVVLTSCYLSSSGPTARWIPAAGGLANIAVGLLSLLASRLARGTTPALRHFFVLAIAFNLLFAAGYPIYSGVAAFGDWAAVISGLSPAIEWRVLLFVVGVVLCYVSLKLIAREIAPFCGSDACDALTRLRRITLIPFLAAPVVAMLAGCFNPLGWTLLFSAALPTAAGAFGLTQLDHFPEARSGNPSISNAPIKRSVGWIILGVVVALLFVALLGPGIRFDAHK